VHAMEEVLECWWQCRYCGSEFPDPGPTANIVCPGCPPGRRLHLELVWRMPRERQAERPV